MTNFLPGLAPRPKVKKVRPPTDVEILVEVWKDIEGVRDREKIDIAKWNKNFFGKHARVCKALLEYLDTVEAVEACMEDVVRFMRTKGKAYSIHTVLKFSDRWKFSQQKGKRF